MEIKLVFKNELDISLWSKEDKIMVTLWGPFISKQTLAKLAEDGRTDIKAIPP